METKSVDVRDATGADAISSLSRDHKLGVDSASERHRMHTALMDITGK